jgi:integrase
VTDALKVALKRAGLPRIRVHDLRHTTATVLLEAGAHPKLVQDLLGHSTVALTLNTYSHVTAGLSDQAARTMDRMLSSVPEEAVEMHESSPPALQFGHELGRRDNGRV